MEKAASGDASGDGRASRTAAGRRSRFASDRRMREFLLRMGPYVELRGWLRGVLVCFAAAIFLTISGAFNSSSYGLGVGFAYWIVLLLLGYVWGSFIAERVISHRRTPEPLWIRVLIISVLITIPFSAVVAVASTVAFGAHFTPAAIPMLLLSVFVVSLVMTALNVLIENAVHPVTHAQPSPPKFLERLPLKLRGSEVWAVEAEDHYLRLHTSKGQDLILLRLADAVAELEGIEGAQVHRSWWVARDAITDAKRGDGRATLTLKDGAEVPVSRTYAGLLRERGWI
jgi:LytTr DNA-binding domain